MTHNLKLNSHHMFSPAMNKDWIFCRSIGYTRIFFQVKPGWSWYGVIKRILVSMLFETPSAEVRSYTIYSPWRGRENVRMLLHARRAKSTAQLGSALFRRLHTILKFLARFVWPFSAFCIHLWSFLSHYRNMNMNGMWKCQNVTPCPCKKYCSVGFGPFPQTAYTFEVSSQTVMPLFCIHFWRFLSHYGNMKGTLKCQNVTACPCEKHCSVGFGPFPQTPYTF
jgi:hypothetical protein